MLSLDRDAFGDILNNPYFRGRLSILYMTVDSQGHAIRFWSLELCHSTLVEYQPCFENHTPAQVDSKKAKKEKK